MTLLVTGSTLNIMSLMGVIMMTGIVVSNSILIVEFAGTLHKQGLSLMDAVVQSCKIRLRPILMTSLATLLGMIPMALGLETGSEQYAPLARAVIGGLGSLGCGNGISGSGRLPAYSRQTQRAQRGDGGGGDRMPKFALKFPYFIIMICLLVTLVGG